MTHEEAELVRRLGFVWNAFLSLRCEHPDDTAEFRHGIHHLQNMILARSARREINGKGPEA